MPDSVRQHVVPTPSPQEQLALLRVEMQAGTGVRQLKQSIQSNCGTGNGWFMEIRQRAKGGLYTVCTNRDGRCVPSRKLLEKAGGFDSSPD